MPAKRLSAHAGKIIDTLRTHPSAYLYRDLRPAACVAWSDYQLEVDWRKAHGEKPVLGSVVRALVARGLMEEIRYPLKRIEYRLVVA